MRPVKTRPKFHCDFCSKTSTREAMERHERICWGNPNRVCDLCGGTGHTGIIFGEGEYEHEFSEPCFYCGQRDTDRLPRGAL